MGGVEIADFAQRGEGVMVPTSEDGRVERPSKSGAGKKTDTLRKKKKKTGRGKIRKNMGKEKGKAFGTG